MRKSTKGIVTVIAISIAVASSGCAAELGGELEFDSCDFDGA